MKVGVFFDNRRGARWTWGELRSGQIALSGTDASLLHITDCLGRLGVVTHLWTSSLLDCPKHETIHTATVDDLSTAVRRAKAEGIDLIVFNNRNNDETSAGIDACDAVSQGYVVWDQNGPTPIFANRLQASPSMARLVLVSYSQADWIRDHAVFERAEVIYNPLAPVEGKGDGSGRAACRVVYVGALVEAKGFHHLARAWSSIRVLVPEAQLFVIGSGQLYNRGELLGPLGVASEDYERTHLIPAVGSSREAALSRGVHFLGLLDRRGVLSQLASATVAVVNPNVASSLETFCVAAIEASAMGAPVVGGAAGGLRETVVDGRTGLLVRSQEDLSHGVVRLLTDPVRARVLGQEGSKWVRRQFDLDMLGRKWATMLQQAVEGRPALLPRFSWRRADARAVLREGIRRLRGIPGMGDRVPTLHQIRSAFRH